MIGKMLTGVEALLEDKLVERQSSGLLLGTQSRTYTPLMKRPTCGELLG